MRLECIVSDITPLKVPKVYRVKNTCGEVELEIELHEDVVEAPRKYSKAIYEVTSNKEECLAHYFCAHGFVVSSTQLENTHRTVISLHGFLVIIKSKGNLGLNTMDHVYVGATFSP